MREDALGHSQLIVSELVTNAVMHGEGSIVLVLALENDHLRTEVIDEGTGNAPAVRTAPGDATGGFGLRIVDELSLRETLGR
jgi:serine/threonine-protein kinase RsbW